MANKKQLLQAVIEGIINDDSAAAEKSLHEYLRLKVRSVIGEGEEGDDGKPMSDSDFKPKAEDGEEDEEDGKKPAWLIKAEKKAEGEDEDEAEEDCEM